MRCTTIVSASSLLALSLISTSGLAGETQGNMRVAQNPQYKICTTSLGSANICTIRRVDQVCPDFNMSIGRQWYSSRAEACEDARGRDNCRGGIREC